MKPVATPPDAVSRRVWLSLSPDDIAALDARARAGHRTRAGQVAEDASRCLRAGVAVAPDGPGAGHRVSLPGDVLRAVERAVGVELRDAAIAAAVRAANKKA